MKPLIFEPTIEVEALEFEIRPTASDIPQFFSPARTEHFSTAPTTTVVLMIPQSAGPFARLRSLQDDWDSYGAPAPSRRAVAISEQVAQAMQDADVAATRIAPSVRGGVGLTHRRGDRKVYVEIGNDGDVIVMLSDGETEPRVQATDLDLLSSFLQDEASAFL